MKKSSVLNVMRSAYSRMLRPTNQFGSWPW